MPTRVLRALRRNAIVAQFCCENAQRRPQNYRRILVSRLNCRVFALQIAAGLEYFCNVKKSNSLTLVAPSHPQCVLSRNRVLRIGHKSS
jgi:hypothetical protein